MYGATLVTVPSTGEYTGVPATAPTSTEPVSGPGRPSWGAIWYEMPSWFGSRATAPGSSTARKATAVTCARLIGRCRPTPPAWAITTSPAPSAGGAAAATGGATPPGASLEAEPDLTRR